KEGAEVNTGDGKPLVPPLEALETLELPAQIVEVAPDLVETPSQGAGESEPVRPDLAVAGEEALHPRARLADDGVRATVVWRADLVADPHEGVRPVGRDGLLLLVGGQIVDFPEQVRTSVDALRDLDLDQATP